MYWADKASGFLVLDEANFEKLGELPRMPVRAYRCQFSARAIWLISTLGTTLLYRKLGTKWPTGKDAPGPFVIHAPTADEVFVQKAYQSARPFCEAFDRLWKMESELNPGYPTFGPCSKVGEISLGLQIATVLGCETFAFVTDGDFGANLACVLGPEKVRRIRADKGGVQLLFENGQVNASLLPHPGSVEESLRRIADIPNVNVASSRAKLCEVVDDELRRFVGSTIEEDVLFPDARSMRLVWERSKASK